MGGDCGPPEVVKGFVNVVRDLGTDVTLVGRPESIETELKKYNYDATKIEIASASEVVESKDEPMKAIKKKDSSLYVGLKMLADGKGDMFISAGNTGALAAGAALIVRRIKGVRRAALAPVISVNKPFMIIDVGANAECTPDFLLQFSYMAHIYMKNVMGIESPRIGLLNIGEEDNKGTALTVKANQLLRESNLNFIGNIEARNILFDKADIIVCDGFSGNLILKFMEGMGKFVELTLKDFFTQTMVTKFSALLLLKNFSKFKKKLDYKEYGGSPILGVRKPVIKAHGNSDARAFFNTAKQAIKFATSGAISEIEMRIKEFDKA
jgi:glycerol-3-phosphate acyltransferase PlsX